MDRDAGAHRVADQHDGVPTQIASHLEEGILGVPQRIRHSVSCQRILEVTRVADERPSRAIRLPEVPRRSRKAPQAANEEEDRIKAVEATAKLRWQGAMRLESLGGCYAAIELAKSEPALRRQMSQLDAHPLWLNTPTATLDLKTGPSWTPRI